MYKFKRIFAIFLSVLLLSLTVGDAFISTNDISCVQATGAEFVAGAAAADAVMEFIIALLASVGAGELAVARQEAIAHGFVDYLTVSQTVNQMLGETAVRFCMSAAPVANTIQVVLWDDLLESLQNYHDSAIDTLTGIYAQYCPELIGIAKDYVEDVVAKNITIAGVTDAFSTPMTAEVVAQQWSGEPFSYSSSITQSYTTKSPVFSRIETSNYTGDFTFPVCGVYSFNSDASFYQIEFLYLNGSNVSTTLNRFSLEILTYVDGVYRGAANYTKRGAWASQPLSAVDNFNFTYSMNFPIFSSNIEAESYLKGTGAVTDALNYSTDITDTITDNNDLPTIGDFAGELWERVANAPDCGIGAYGSGALVGDWADDIPWLGLDDLQAFVDNIQDVFDKTIEGILDGTYDLPSDIPDYTYGDAWIDAIDRTWDDVIDNPVNDPAIDKPDNPDKPAIGDKDDPITGDKDTTIPIDIPADDLVPTMNDSLGDIAGNLKYKFPFSIPWDIRHVFQVLADTPRAPRFELPLVIKRFNIDERIIVDMAMFQVLSNLSRSLFSMLFGMYLMNLTFKVVAMRKEE